MVWNEEKTEEVIRLYKENVELGEIASKLMTSVVSVRNKLVREQVYKVAEKAKVVTKELMVRDIEGETNLKLPSMLGMKKSELSQLRDWLLDED